MKYLRIEANREGYAPYQIERTMTVGELREYLEEYDDEMPVYLSHDRGYTYGGITGSDISEDEYEKEW